MARGRRSKRNAWVIVAAERKPSPQPVTFCNVPPGQPIAILPVRTIPETIQSVVDAFVQCLSLNTSPNDLIPYITKKGAPYPAKKTGWSQEIHGGYDPYVEAFRVDDLEVITDPKTGAESFRFTRKTPEKPEFIRRREKEDEEASR